MFGAILGDIIGSPYEFDMGDKTKNFPLFVKESYFTDDTVMTVAVADALLNVDLKEDSDEQIKESIIYSLKHWGKKYPNAGYGSRFNMWLKLDNTEAYGSYGNGSAMRVSAAGWLAESLEEARRLARLSAEVTHNHPEGIKGAEATASAIYMARDHYTKDEIKEYIVREFGYDLGRTCDDIRPDYRHVESCQQTVPEAITAFLEGEDFEDVIRTAVSLGGDCDTLTAIAGSIAEGYYGVPYDLKYECYQRVDSEIIQILSRFERRCHFDEGTNFKYSPLFWFTKNENGYVQLQRPYVEPVTMKNTCEKFETSQEAIDGWRRSMLYKEAFDVWDIMAFGIWVGETLAFGPFVEEDGQEVMITFTSPQTADRTVYTLLAEEDVALSKEYVEAFYSVPRMQLDWHKLILHPVVMKVYKDGRIEPVFIGKVNPKVINISEFQIYRFKK